MMNLSDLNAVAKLIDHTNLKATATPSDILHLCKEAIDWGFKSVCVNSSYVPLVKNELSGSDVKVCAVVGFPLGMMSSDLKVAEATWCYDHGADELDVVLNIGQLKAGNIDYVTNELGRLREQVPNAVLKLILETCYLTKDEIKLACELAVQSKFDFVKTSTGFGSGGATPEDVALMKSVVKNKAEVKASGGIRTFEDLKRMVEAGATRIGASRGVEIMEQAKSALTK